MTEPQDTERELAPQESEQITDLADRAESLISRRTMLISTGRKLVLPMLVTCFVSREAMAAGGSGPISNNRSSSSWNKRRQRFRQRRRRWRRWRNRRSK